MSVIFGGGGNVGQAAKDNIAKLIQQHPNASAEDIKKIAQQAAPVVEEVVEVSNKDDILNDFLAEDLNVEEVDENDEDSLMLELFGEE